MKDKEKHKVVRVDNLMYKGCEPHWKCIKCGIYIPFHCYTKEQLENMYCKENKDKEKQIYKHFDEEVCSKLDCKRDCKYYGKANCKTCIHEDICQLRTYSYYEEEVKEKGCEHYQPIPEDSVVLSKEEYENYQNLKRDVEHSFEYNQGYTDGQNKASKETAEKFINLPDSDILVIDTKEYGEIEVVSVERLQELAKQFGVGIKE